MARKKVITWGSLIDRFETELGIEGLGERTLKSYVWTMSRAVDFWGHDSDPLAITEDDIYNVLGRWRRQGCSPTTIANRISCFHTFFRWLSKKHRKFDPAREINRPRKDKPEKRWLSAGQVEDLLLAAARSERDHLVVWLVAMTGVRRQELRDLRWRDVDAEACVLRVVLGKGRKGRTVELPPPLCTLLADTRARLQEAGEYAEANYVCPRTRIVDSPRGPSVRYWRDEPMGETTPNKVLIRLAREVGLADPSFVGPHVMRRSFAQAFLEANPEKIYELKALLGHSRIDTTETYLPVVDRGRVKESVERITWFGAPEDDA